MDKFCRRKIYLFVKSPTVKHEESRKMQIEVKYIMQSEKNKPEDCNAIKSDTQDSESDKTNVDKPVVCVCQFSEVRLT